MVDGVRSSDSTSAWVVDHRRSFDTDPAPRCGSDSSPSATTARDRPVRAMIGLALSLALVATACGGSSTTDATGVASATSAQTSGADSTVAPQTDEERAVTESSTDGVDARSDVPPTCDLVTEDEVAALVGFEVTAGETISGGCVYDPVDESETTFFLNTTALPISTSECAGLLPTEPLFAGESVEAVTGLGSQAALVTAQDRADFFACSDGVMVSVELLGLEGLTADEHVAVSRAIIDLMLGRL